MRSLMGLTAAIVLMNCVAPAVEAQQVTLRVHPKVGDTLWMKMDQTFQMVGDSSGDPKLDKPIVAVVRVCTHTVVLGNATNGTELESVTDSVNITPDMVTMIPLFANMRQALDGRKVHLRIAENGAITILGDSASATVSAVSMQMPPMLPDDPVSVGETWVRELPVPVSTAQTAHALVRATFRLDSLGADRNIAYISMNGTLTPPKPTSGHADSKPRMTGTLVSTMQIDLRLGWMTESRATVTFSSTVRPSRDAAPVLVHMKVTQWLRAVPRQ